MGVVVAADGLVVVVVGADVVVVPDALVVVVVVGAAVVVVTGADVPSMACSSANSVADGTLGSDFEEGPNPTVISWLLRNRRLAGRVV